MCGIAGTTTFGRSAPDRDFVAAACAAMRHRGPDEDGAHHGADVSLGMCRLKVIGLVGGSQPAYGADERVVCVVNGEIYNHRALRELLARRGRYVRGTSDVHVIPALYEEFGDAFVEHLHGMFAIALHDGRKRRLLLVTDRVGKKPLFHARPAPDTVAFASELAAVLEHAGVDREIDPVAVDQYLSYRVVHSPRTIYRGVRKVPPATVLAFEADGTTHERRYWSFPYTGELADIDEDEAVDRLDALLRQAVADRLESEVPLGAMLSGGLDSSLVVAVARRLLGRRLHTFSVGFDHPAFDESAAAAFVATHFGTRHHTRRLTAADARNTADTILRHVGEPFAFPSAIASHAMYELAGRHVTVVLTGDGSDEVFAGYNRYKRFLVAPGGDLADRYESVLVDGVPTHLKRALYGRGLLERLPDFPVNHLREQFARTHEQAEDLDRAMHVDSGAWLLDAQLVKIDRMSMAHSVEPRSPLLDHRLIDVAARIPASRKLVGGNEKALLKKVAARYLPDEVVNRRKQELAVPLERWLGTELRADIQSTLLADSSLERGYFNPDALRALVLEFRPEHSYALWTLHMLERWHLLHVDRTDLALEPAH